MANNHLKDSLNLIKNEEYFKTLDQSSTTLRELAGETGAFLLSLKTNTPQLHSLANTFISIKTTPIETIDETFDEISKTYHQLIEEAVKDKKLPADEADWLVFLDKQNRFNAEANLLFANAIIIGKSYQAEQQ